MNRDFITISNGQIAIANDELERWNSLGEHIRQSDSITSIFAASEDDGIANWRNAENTRLIALSERMRQLDQDMSALMGIPREASQGVRIQLENSDPIESNLTVENLTEYLQDIFQNRQPSRNVVMYTRQGGMELFHRLLAEEADNFLTQNPVTPDETYSKNIPLTFRGKVLEKVEVFQ